MDSGPTNSYFYGIPSGKRLHSCRKSQFLVGTSTISMAILNSYVRLPEGKTFHNYDPKYQL
jgi:hypothetical protein